MGLQRFTRGYRGLLARRYKGLQAFTRGHRGFHGVTRC